MKQGFVGMSATNTTPVMCPTRSMEAGLGTNPLSFAAPSDNGDSFVLDMATTAVAYGKIEIKKRKGESIPEGWAYDLEGNVTTDAKIACKSFRMSPLGGDEVTSGFKGYGLSAMVEILCGILAGANFSTKIRTWDVSGSDTEANLGQFFMAIDPKCFAPNFSGRLSEMQDILRNLTPLDPTKPVMVPGDPENNHMRKVDYDGGVQYSEDQMKTCNELSTRLGVTPLKIV